VKPWISLESLSFVFSIPHGNVRDKTVEGLQPFLEKGDIIMDASNEYWLNTEQRQKKLLKTGIHYIGMGVSGGYQSARHESSISPGADEEALDNMMPFLRKVAAKDKNGRPCTMEVGPHGSGHHVKLGHKGIEQGMMSTLCEVWMIMNQSLNMTYEEIADTWEQWNKSGPLRDNFLVDIKVDICRTKDPEDSSKFLLAKIRDKEGNLLHPFAGEGIVYLETASLEMCYAMEPVYHVSRIGALIPGIAPGMYRGGPQLEAINTYLQSGDLYLNFSEISRGHCKGNVSTFKFPFSISATTSPLISPCT
jgi:hypothetical protein